MIRTISATLLPVTLYLAGCYISSDPEGVHLTDASEDGPADPVADPETQSDNSADEGSDESDCDIGCPTGWTEACRDSMYWCISPAQVEGDCCLAWEWCEAHGAVPGFWPDAGPHDDILPPDFLDVAAPPAAVITFSAYIGDNRLSNISCISADMERVRGATFYPPADPDTCANDVTCVPWDYSPDHCGDLSEADCCGGLGVGCGCRMPFWCVMY